MDKDDNYPPCGDCCDCGICGRWKDQLDDDCRDNCCCGCMYCCCVCPCLPIVFITKCCCNTHFSLTKCVAECFLAFSECCNIIPEYRYKKASREYDDDLSLYNHKLKQYQEEKAKALKIYAEKNNEEEEKYQNRMVEFNKATDLCNEKLALQRNYEAKRKTISNFLRITAEKLNSLLEKGEAITIVSLNAFREEAYLLVIELSIT